MGISMEERMQQLSLQKNTQGIGENSVNGGRADNRGENSGVMKSGDATDSGKGGGSVTGGNTLNLHTNNHIMGGGAARNDGDNNGEIEGGHSTNLGLNNNELNGGSATNELGSVNHKNSFIKGGNAVRELQSGIEKYQGMQKQLADANKEIIRKNNELLNLQKEIESQKLELQKQQQALADQAFQSEDMQGKLDVAQQLLAQSEKEKQSLNNELVKAKGDVSQLRSDMKAQRGEIDKLKVQVDAGKQELQELEAKLDQANGDKEKLEERLKVQQDRNKKQEEKITEIQGKIDGKQKEVAALNDKLADEGKNQAGLNAKIQRLENDIDNLKGILNKKVEKESECSSKVSQLKEKISVLEMEKKELDSLLQRELQSYTKLAEEYRLYKLSVKTDMATFKQLKPMLTKIGDLANQGEEILNEPSQTTTVTLTTATYSSETETPLGSVSAGFAQNSGDNSGTIRGGDSISNSIVVNGMVIDDEQAANKLAEGMSSLAQTAESIVNDAGNSVKGSIGSVGVFVQTQTPYQVW
jgi:chromosome segregation ATPase